MRPQLRGKHIVWIAVAALAAAVLAGCATTANTGTSSTTARAAQGVSQDSVLTLAPVDQSKTLITVRAEYNIDDQHMEEALEKQFPDVDFVFVLHASVDSGYELMKSVSNDEEEDIVLARNVGQIGSIAADHLLDLSAQPFVDNYTDSSIKSCEVDGNIYYLPGPANIFGIIYDKTMFEQNGWKVPTSYSEFIELCNTINATGIRAFQPTCQYARQSQTMFTAFDYDDILAGASNYEWITEYQKGDATMAGHMEPAFARFDELHAAGIIEASDYDLSPAARSTMMYTDHACAMIVESQLAQGFAKQFKSDHEYAMMPFWCGDNADSDVLITVPNYYVAANKHVADDPAKEAKVLEVLDYISSPEGQLALAGGSLSTQSSVKDTPMTTTDFNSGIMDTVSKGNCMTEPKLMAAGDGNAAEKALRSGLQQYLQGAMTAEQVMTGCDTARDKALASGVDLGKTLGTSTDDFTPMQTGVFIADALRDWSGADVALAIVGQTNCGTDGRLYKGDVTEKDVAQIQLSINKSTNGLQNDKKLWVLSMTGKQLEALVETPIAADLTDSIHNEPYFVASGLNITFAPWADADARVEAVTLPDGSALDPDKTYAVALWCWPFEGECTYPVDKVYDDADTAIIGAYIEKLGTISPDNGGMTLDWGDLTIN